MDCWLGANDDELLFRFKGVQAPDLTQIIFDFTNFHNPWSAVTIESITISSYESADCSGDAHSAKSVGPQTFYPKTTPAERVLLQSSSNVLGDSSPTNKIVFAWTPLYTTSLDGKGVININIPEWYRVFGRLSMMFNENVSNSCTSPDMEITESRPDIISRTITIRYKNMAPDKISGSLIKIVC